MIYLDNNATTRVDPEALEAMLPFLRDKFANPSGAYAFSREIRPALIRARGQVAGLLGCREDEVVFTSGGTESDITAIRSAVRSLPERRHLVTCATEHPAVLAPLRELEAEGFELTVLGVDADGRIDLEALEAAVRPGGTALVTLMWANNETGVIQPVMEAAAIAAESGALFHTDAVQAAGKIPVDFAAAPIHYLSISAHKLHGPKGIGALVVRRDAPFHPMVPGGGQENGRRSGTENVPGIVGLGAAAEAAARHLGIAASTGSDPVAVRRDRFESGLMEALEGVHRNGPAALRTPNTASLRFDGIEAEGLLVRLDRSGVCCSAGSACHTGALKPSTVLTAMGLGAQEARATARFSLSRFTTDEEVAEAVPAVADAVRRLRALRPGGARVVTAHPSRPAPASPPENPV